ncbi:MAG TPA: cation:proton antiporter subunit C [Pirellulales bacterium]|jgi:multicomponent Na+:H+ antiporter subunit C|nr:cation:proton antiporter subunit C [Pirellulales bacterium]
MSTVGYVVAAWLFVIGAYGIASSRHLVHLCLCLAVVQASTYVLLAVIGYRPDAPAPILIGIKPDAQTVDPVVQALMLTDIVVEATVLALLLSLIVQIDRRTGSVDPDEVDLMRG